AGTDSKSDLDICVRTERFIDPLAGLGRQRQPRAGPGRCLPGDMIAAGKTSGGVDEHGMNGGIESIGQTDLGAALLVERAQGGAPVSRRDGDPALAASALQNRDSRYRHHAHTIRCRRTSGRSRSLAGPAWWIAPRSM